MKGLLFLVLLSFFLSKNCVGQIDTNRLNRNTIYYFLISSDSSKKDSALKYIADNTAAIEPLILIMGGIDLYSKGYNDSSMYWLFLGDVRSLYVSSLYKELSMTALSSSFHKMVMELTEGFTLNNSETGYKKINQALAYDLLNPYNLLNSLENMIDTSKFIPREKWKQNYDNIRKNFYRFADEILQNGNKIFNDSTILLEKPN